MGIIANKLAEEARDKKAAEYDAIVKENENKKIAKLGMIAGAKQAYDKLIPELDAEKHRADMAESGLANILSSGSGVAQQYHEQTNQKPIPTHWR